MSRPRIVLLSSLAILGMLLIATVTLIPRAEGFTRVQREQLSRVGDNWVLQLDIINHEGQQTRFNIDIGLGDKHYYETAWIPDGRRYSYQRYIDLDLDGADSVQFAVYREGDTEPIEQGRYYIE